MIGIMTARAGEIQGPGRPLAGRFPRAGLQAASAYQIMPIIGVGLHEGWDGQEGKVNRQLSTGCPQNVDFFWRKLSKMNRVAIE